jgi:hypothetical protein
MLNVVIPEIGCVPLLVILWPHMYHLLQPYQHQNYMRLHYYLSPRTTVLLIVLPDNTCETRWIAISNWKLESYQILVC